MNHKTILAFLAGASFAFFGFFVGRGTGEPGMNRNDQSVMAVLWYQRSAEAEALYHQAFNIARMRIDQDLAGNSSNRKRAVVVDIDETVLNNSPHSAKLIRDNQVFPYAWNEWVNRAEAEPLPGSVGFLNYAVSKGCDVYYVSNRSAATELAGTMKNLTARGFPQVTRDHVLLKENESSKEARRKSIAATHRIVVLMGDNLNDLAAVFERKSVAERSAEVEKLKNEFGNRFIVLPNPMYGDWESALYGYRRGLTDAEKDSARIASLQSF